MFKKIVFPVCLMMFISCGGNKNRQTTDNHAVEPKVQVPIFNADTAYMFVKKQVDFGARVPQTPAHKQCLGYLSQTLQKYGFEVEIQKGTGTLYDGKSIDIQNIIGFLHPNASRRILLCSHWDTRPFADRDADESKHKTPILGANDGASGVGVLLEVARNLNNLPENLGIDIIFFDVEDYGVPEFYTGRHISDTWCLGSKYWAKNPHKADYKADYGILLDMVGAPMSKFPQELFSLQYAPHIVQKVWNRANEIGFDAYFTYLQGGSIIDDHYPINTIRKIPTIDIIQFDRNSETGFGSYWHTTQDNMSCIDKNTLYAVGTTLLNVIFNE